MTDGPKIPAEDLTILVAAILAAGRLDSDDLLDTAISEFEKTAAELRKRGGARAVYRATRRQK